MRAFFFLLALISSQSIAGFEKLSVKNLNLTYQAPYGEGTLEKVGFGYSLKEARVPYRISIERTLDRFEVTSEFLDFSWINPYKFFYNLEQFSAKGLDFSIGEKSHFLEAKDVTLMPKGRGSYLGNNLKFQCNGDSSGELKVRVLEDCRNNLDVTIKRIEVPADFVLYQILYDIPRIPTEADIPGDNFVLNARQGQFNMQLYIKYYVYAGLRAYGAFHYENNYETLAIKVNQIKFGFLNVTNFVMRRLKAVVKSPDVLIDPPWIRINIGRPNEDR